jgi:hypothetical protein
MRPLFRSGPVDQDEAGLFALAGAFGLGFAGLVPNGAVPVDTICPEPVRRAAARAGMSREGYRGWSPPRLVRL